jgi:signal transduction histidine kinase
MAVSRFSQRVLRIIGLGVALPALVLAGLAIYLSMRITGAVSVQSARYNTYIAQQVAQAFEVELLAHMRRAIAPAENAARNGANLEGIRRALATEDPEFSSPHVVSLDQLDGYLLLLVESQPLLFSPGMGEHGRHWFVGLLLRDPDGMVMGAGGWWIDPDHFLRENLRSVVEERVNQDPRMYGGIESTRGVSVQLFDAAGRQIARMRDPGHLGTARPVPLAGPFEGYTLRVSATSDTPVVWAGRFVAIEMFFVLLLAGLIVVATVFGLRYTVRQLELAQLKSSFLANVTHELKTPIALIQLAAETLDMHRVRSPEESAKFLRSIQRETKRLTQLVDNILDFARLESGQHAFHFRPVDLTAVARETLESLAPRLDELGFQVEVDLPEDLPPAQGDGRILSHCVLNLVDNAIKYSRDRKWIRVAGSTDGATVRLAVSDRGIGIAPDDQKRVFEKFVRIEAGLVHDVKGAGLGLALVDQIVRAHGGHVEVTSAPGEGSTFTLVLPLASAAAPQRPEPRRTTGT